SVPLHSSHPRFSLLLLLIRPPPRSPLFPYTTLFRSAGGHSWACAATTQLSASRPCSPIRDNREWRTGITEPAVPEDQAGWCMVRSEEHTSELQSRENLVCRLLLEKKKKNT